MPNQYTFSDFDPREFEFLCRDLLQRKITKESNTPFFFNSFSEGADGGIDAVFEDDKQKIILQCKRYSDFDTLYTKLKYFELPKVIKLNPTRYIIATSCKLSQKQMEKIYMLFKSYLRDINDILGQAMINNLLACYPDIELNYPRLYLNNASVLKRLLQANVYNQSLDKLRKYKNISKYYVPDDSFQRALKILGDKRYVIISGEPGVGKSMLAGMLSLYYLEQGYEFIFLRRSISEAEGNVWNEQQKQLFFFDDFLGSTNFEGFDRNEDRQLLDFISKIVDSSNKLLLITTREYVFKQAEAVYPELKKLHFTKCLIRQKEFTSAFKINILYNYLYYSEVEFKHIKPLLYDEHYIEIIHHNNFTPRLINDYIEQYYNKYEDSYSLFFGLKKYLDDPYAYWEEIFRKLNENAQMLLFIVAITEEPAIDELLFNTFIRVGLHRKIYEKGYERDSFNQAIAELSESFISLSRNPEISKEDGYISSLDYSLIHMSFRTSKYLEFQNPSIKDFAVNYLRKREDLVAFLICGATLFNQLYFVFTTIKDDKRIEDYEANIPFTVGKIILSPSLCDLVAEKMMQEFDTLPIAKVRRIDWRGGDSSYHLNADQFDNRIEKLWLLCHYFPLDRHETVLKFVKEKYEQLLHEDKMAKQATTPGSDYCSLSLEERIMQTDIIKKLHPFVPFDPLETVRAYYHNIRFAKEFIFLYSLKDIFPDAYHEVVTLNIKEIRSKIKNLIYDDIDHYLWEGTHEADEAIDELVDIDLEQLEEIYKFKLSKKLMRDINDMSDRELFRLEPKKKSESLIDEQEEEDAGKLPEDNKLDEQKYEGYKLALERLIPHWSEEWDDEAVALYIRSKIKNNSIAESLLNRIDNNEYYKDFLENIKSVDLLLGYLKRYEEDANTAFFFYEKIIQGPEFKDADLINLQEVAYHLYINGLFVFRKETFELAKPKNNIQSVISISQYSNILEQHDIWLRFPSKTFHIFLAARYILSLSPKDRIATYKNFEEHSMYYEDKEIFWRFCYEADKNLFCTHFIIPVIQTVLDSILDIKEEGMIIKFLKKYEFSYDFDFREEEQRFELWSGGGGDALLEDISNAFEEWNIPNIFGEVEDCFNISLIKNPALNRYMRDHCPVVDGEYTINISHELVNKEFQKLLKSAGVVKVITNYIKTLKELTTNLEHNNL